MSAGLFRILALNGRRHFDFRSRSCPISTPQISVDELDRACCRIWRTTSLSTSKVGCSVTGFGFAFMSYGSGLRVDEPMDPALALRRHTECIRSRDLRRAP